MPECLPDIPAGSTVRQNTDGSWQYQRLNVGPWLPIPAPQSGLPWKTDGPAVPESREPASVATEARPLSPAVQAVRDAWLSSEKGARMLGDPSCLAAALRAAADQVVPDLPVPRVPEYPSADQVWPFHLWQSNQKARFRLLAIAAELEQSP